MNKYGLKSCLGKDSNNNIKFVSNSVAQGAESIRLQMIHFPNIMGSQRQASSSYSYPLWWVCVGAAWRWWPAGRRWWTGCGWWAGWGHRCPALPAPGPGTAAALETHIVAPGRSAVRGGGNGDEVEMLAQEEAFKFVMQKKKIQTALVKQLLPTVLKTLVSRIRYELKKVVCTSTFNKSLCSTSYVIHQ